MNKFKSLNIYQKTILFLSIGIAIVFAGIYNKAINRIGYSYKGAILVPVKENGNVVYSGSLGNKPVTFTVYTDKTVEYLYGNELYGPYTAMEDPEAIPRNIDNAHMMKGVKLYNGQKIMFHGSVLKTGSLMLLYNQDGSAYFTAHAVTSNGEAIGPDGEIMDTVRPSAEVILDLMGSPALTHKGEWGAWFFGVFICILNIITILFADKIFRFALSFRIRHTEDIRPSDWEIASRYVSWTVLVAVELYVFTIGVF